LQKQIINIITLGLYINDMVIYSFVNLHDMYDAARNLKKVFIVHRIQYNRPTIITRVLSTRNDQA